MLPDQDRFDPGAMTSEQIIEVLVDYLARILFHQVTEDAASTWNRSPSGARTIEAENELFDLIKIAMDRYLAPRLVDGVGRLSKTEVERAQLSAMAERSYKSLGDWLHPKASTVRQYGPKVYVQGSFRLSMTIRPLNEAEEYDVDSVYELQKLGKISLTQKQLKTLLGVEIEAYRRAQNMSKPLREGRRCWVLDYADGAQFHMDIVPALANGQAARVLLEARGLDARWTTTAIAITDKEGQTTPPLRMIGRAPTPRDTLNGSRAGWPPPSNVGSVCSLRI